MELKLDRDFPLLFQPHCLNAWEAHSITEMHIHNCFEIHYVNSGAGVYFVADKVMPFKAGDAVVINNREMHAEFTARGIVSDLTYISFDPAGLLRPLLGNPAVADASVLCGPRFHNVRSPDRDPRLCQLVRDLIGELERHATSRRDVIRCMVYLLMTETAALDGVRKPDDRALPAESADYARVEPALLRIQRGYGGEITVAELARLCNASVTHFIRLFDRTMGKTPKEYLTDYRIATAAARLRSTSARVSAIAYECGFNTLAAFNKMFRKRMGVAPRQWRRSGTKA